VRKKVTMAGYFKKVRISYLLLFFFVAIFALGLFWGGFSKVLANGIVICLDCIGLI